jgi:flagella basal body P-ring formation protein FlgA
MRLVNQDNMSARRGFVIALAIALLLALTAPSRSAVILTPERVAAALQRYAVEHGPWRPENIEVRILPFAPVSLPTGLASIRILRPTAGVTPGLHSFLIAAISAGKEQARFWVKADLRVIEEVVVSSNPLSSKEIFKPSDVRLERRDVSGLYARPFYRIDDVVGQQAVRTIPVNETLTQRSVERPAVMRRGSPVVLLYETGSLRIESPGISEEPGRTGEMIQVRNPTSGKLLRGLVLDGRVVRVN